MKFITIYNIVKGTRIVKAFKIEVESLRYATHIGSTLMNHTTWREHHNSNVSKTIHGYCIFVLHRS